MYKFEAHYTEVLSGVDVIREIEFDPRLFPARKDCYLYAMDRAYDMERKDLPFRSLELIFL